MVDSSTHVNVWVVHDSAGIAPKVVRCEEHRSHRSVQVNILKHLLLVSNVPVRPVSYSSHRQVREAGEPVGTEIAEESVGVRLLAVEASHVVQAPVFASSAPIPAGVAVHYLLAGHWRWR
jgi:hypothetical protein